MVRRFVITARKLGFPRWPAKGVGKRDSQHAEAANRARRSPFVPPAAHSCENAVPSWPTGTLSAGIIPRLGGGVGVQHIRGLQHLQRQGQYFGFEVPDGNSPTTIFSILDFNSSLAALDRLSPAP